MSDKNTHELTEKEKIRVEKVKIESEALKAQGYNEVLLLVPLKKAIRSLLFISVPLILIMFILFLLKNQLSFSLNNSEMIIFVISALVLIVVHELIHAVTWKVVGKVNPESVEFGFIKEKMTPYCSCTQPVSKGRFLAAAFMPCLILGIILSIIAIFIGSSLLINISAFNILGAGGDLAIIHKVLKYKSSCHDQLLVDHPTEGGCILYEK